MNTPINTFQDILEALERNPVLAEFLRQHILSRKLLKIPARLVRM